MTPAQGGTQTPAQTPAQTVPTARRSRLTLREIVLVVVLVGVRLFDLPITAERVYTALHAER